MASDDDLPRLSALFAVRFDQRVGYTVSWSKTVPGLALSGVEFKSLPSGSHNVKEDLVYFVQDRTHAGLSAFRSDDASAAARNASFSCVGALVPLNGSRLGRIWLHAPELRRLAQASHGDTEDTSILESYWKEHRVKDAEPKPLSANPSSPVGAKSRRKMSKSGRKRALSESTNLLAAAPYSFHPARSLPQLLDTFGPLLFPIYRAALLRKRILLIRKSPVQATCDFVYLLSVMSSIPNDTLDAILAEAPTRTTAKFSVGITEISELEQPLDTVPGVNEDEEGWLACTTDELLAIKTQLYDLKVEFPGSGSTGSEVQKRSWPLITESQATLGPPGRGSKGKQQQKAIRATPRDARRFKALRQALRRLNRPSSAIEDDEDDEDDGNDDLLDDDADEDRPLLQPQADEVGEDAKQVLEKAEDEAIPADREAVEPQPWAAIAYDSFVWWASAGERSIEIDEEDLQHKELLSSTGDSMEYARPSSASSRGRGGALEDSSTAAAVVGYFHRWTHVILSTLADIVEEAEAGATGEQQDNDIVSIGVGKEDLARMGLDVWSKGDKQFVGELCRMYFGVEAHVEGRSVECCGVRVM